MSSHAVDRHRPTPIATVATSSVAPSSGGRAAGELAADALVAEIDDRSARGVAAAVNRMITSGRLVPDTRLPTVRDLARRLGVSPTTISEAWQSLAVVGAVEGRGRRGTFVRTPTGAGAPNRYRRITEGPGHFTLDLSTGTPDPALLPNVAAVVGALSERSLTSTYLDPAVLPALEERLRRTWPFVPEAMTVVDGAMDALDRIAQQVVRLGDRAIVEQPTFPPLLDLLEHLGAEIIGVPMDGEGMRPEAFAEAVERQPASVFCQLRAHNPTGVTTTARRARALAKILAGSAAVIVEDDHSGDIAMGRLVSFGTWLPDRTVHIRSFSKSHGPDLRLAAVGGAGAVVRAVANRRMLGAGWTSRILQAVLLAMLDDRSTVTTVQAARDRYRYRRDAVCRVLARRGVGWTGDDGINLWLGVADERAAMLALATHGIGVAPGSPFLVGEDTAEHDHWLRVTVGQVADDDLERVAHLLADAARTPPTWR